MIGVDCLVARGPSLILLIQKSGFLGFSLLFFAESNHFMLSSVSDEVVCALV
jgi:hypothetical protein